MQTQHTALASCQAFIVWIGFTVAWNVPNVHADDPAAVVQTAGKTTVPPAPEGATINTAYRVKVNGRDVPVFAAKVASENAQMRWKAMDDKPNSAKYFDTAAFASFDFSGAVTVEVTISDSVTSAKILPTSAGVEPNIQGQTVSFSLSSASKLTIEINGETTRSLHLFANDVETNIPDPNDPNVIYFGPGTHEVSRLVVHDNQTLYIAGGAIVRTVVDPDEAFTTNPDTGLRRYAPSIELRGKNIHLRGRGVIDASACPTHARDLLLVNGSDITVSGVTFLDASTWNMPIRRSDRVWVHDVKMISYRANSDGIDICNSRDVTVEDCFLRTLDDLVVIKTDKGQGVANRILVKRCVLWNQVAHALSIGAEIREDITNVLFADCDVIHDRGREWTLRIFHTDAAKVSDVQFENIRIEESEKLISLWIGQSMWSRDDARGQIQNVFFRDIAATGVPLDIELTCDLAEQTLASDRDRIENILFENVLLNSTPLSRNQINISRCVENLIVEP
ncbi:glycosyl hydrolase family 28 protein [Rhodopirellula sallentina]|uniref:Endo-polygalacturonase n=1 Tax=Rhodopirellula sallentina SM41 TaxID=1263870 RepID=M5U139_9BACT|nr:glycosyl hydrolase family 28 protein [Rhodopirellula sallentina]EMI55160.1 endo-polygalacturonase [Rhodopirellula sallentina SM41]